MQITNSSYGYYKSIFTSQSLNEHSSENTNEVKSSGKNDQVVISLQAQKQMQVEQFLANKPMTKLYYTGLAEKNAEDAEAFINDMMSNYGGSRFAEFDAFSIAQGINNADELKIELDNVITAKKAQSVSRVLIKTNEFLETARLDKTEHGHMTGTYLNNKAFSIEISTDKWDDILGIIGSDLDVFSEKLKEAASNKDLVNFTSHFINEMSDEQKSFLKGNNYLGHPTFAGMGIDGIEEFSKQYDEIPGYLNIDEPYSYYNADGKIASDAIYKLKNLSSGAQSVLYSHECTLPVVFGEGLFLRDDRGNIVLVTGKKYDPQASLTSDEIQESLKSYLGEHVYDYINNGLKNGFYGDADEVQALLQDDGIKAFFDGSDPAALYEQYPSIPFPYSIEIPEGAKTVIADENTVLVFPPEIFELPEDWQEGSVEHSEPASIVVQPAETDSEVGETSFLEENTETIELSLGESLLNYIKQKTAETDLLGKSQEEINNELLSEVKKFWIDMIKNPQENSFES